VIVSTLKAIPVWVWAIILGLSAIEPATHLWLQYFLPAGMVHSGIHHADSVIFIHAMRMFDTDFFAPYVSCESPLGPHSYRYFPVPFLWMYGAAGSLGRFLHFHEFQWLGIINAVGMVIYLTTAYGKACADSVFPNRQTGPCE